VELVTQGGRRVWVYVSRILHARPGQPPEFFCFDVDVTDRKRAEDELAVRQAELLHAARLSSVGQMVAALSHEVAQPLSAVGNFAAAAGLVLDGPPSTAQWEKLREYNQEILRQNERCGAILQRLRDFTRRSAVRRVPCDLNHLLNESVDLIAHELRRSEVRISWQLAELLPSVLVDRIQLQQVVVNLLTNARDAVRDQPPERRAITIRSAADGSVADGPAVQFEVADRGSGLPEGVAQRLFEPFVTTKERGMGIGLSICRTIIRDHGGSIEAAAHPEGGAIFRVRLPAGEERRP
jgi:two-component system sensor kinase FixL